MIDLLVWVHSMNNKQKVRKLLYHLLILLHDLQNNFGVMRFCQVFVPVSNPNPPAILPTCCFASVSSDMT